MILVTSLFANKGRSSFLDCEVLFSVTAGERKNIDESGRLLDAKDR